MHSERSDLASELTLFYSAKPQRRTGAVKHEIFFLRFPLKDTSHETVRGGFRVVGAKFQRKVTSKKNDRFCDMCCKKINEYRFL